MKPQSVLLTGFSVVTVLMVMITSLALFQMDRMENHLHKVVHDYEAHARLMMKMRTAARERIRILHTMLSMDDPFDIEDAVILIQQFGEEFLTHRGSLENMDLTLKEQSLLDLQRRLSITAVKEQRNAIAQIQEGSTNAATHTIIDRATPAQDEALAIMDDFISLQKNKSDSALSQSIDSLETTRTRIIVLLFATIVIAISITHYVIGHITNAFNRVRSSENREKAIRDNMVEGVITISDAGIIESSNASACHMFGYSQSELVGNNVSMLMPEPQHSHHDEYLAAYLTGGEPKIIGIGREVVGQKKDKSQFPIDLSVSELIHEGQHLFVGILDDITERKEAQQALQQAHDELEDKVAKRTKELSRANRQLEMLIQEKVATQEQLTYLANYDELTGLPNRTLFYEQLRSRISQCKRNAYKFALLFLDLDGFKTVNDTLGHKMGDDLLKEVAQRIKSCLRESDDIARLGGDEFTVMTSTDIDERVHEELVAEKIIQAVSEPYTIDGNHIEIGTSIGISLYPSDSDDKQTLITYADEAMYQVKSKGKNHYIYYRDIHT